MKVIFWNVYWIKNVYQIWGDSFLEQTTKDENELLRTPTLPFLSVFSFIVNPPSISFSFILVYNKQLPILPKEAQLVLKESLACCLALSAQKYCAQFHLCLSIVPWSMANNGFLS